MSADSNFANMNIDGNVTISTEHKSLPYSVDVSDLNSSEQEDSDSSTVSISSSNFAPGHQPWDEFQDEFVYPFVEEMQADPGPDVCKQIFKDLIRDKEDPYTPLWPFRHLTVCLYEVIKLKKPQTYLSETKYKLSHDQVVLLNELIKRVKEKHEED